ncbi:amine oxidase [Cadophora sp. DSE1049]|nr:amine oxidase [Cadophora sp. DSE1049]
MAAPLYEYVVVIGAGLSGLYAAWEIQKAGLTCVVLESKDQVGGKALSVASKTGNVEFGPAWINLTNQTYVAALVKKFNIEVIDQYLEGDLVLDFGGKYKRVKAEDLYKLSKDLGIDIDSLTLEEFVRTLNPSEMTLEHLNIHTRGIWGLEASEMSALFFFYFCKNNGGLKRLKSQGKDGMLHLRIRQGTQVFATGITAQLSKDSVVLRSPVTKIEQSSDNAVVITSSRAFECQQVILSTQPPLYNRIVFEPPLPTGKAELARLTKLGNFSKTIVVYEHPWWRNAGLSGIVQSAMGPAFAMLDTCNVMDHHHSLTCFIDGEPGIAWSKKSKNDREREVLDQIEASLGAHARSEDPIQILEYQWIHDEWSQGANGAVMPPGLMTKHGAALDEPFGRIHFVGAEIANSHMGSMEGALRSGEKGAQAVIQNLQNEINSRGDCEIMSTKRS